MTSLLVAEELSLLNSSIVSALISVIAYVSIAPWNSIKSFAKFS